MKLPKTRIIHCSNNGAFRCLAAYPEYLEELSGVCEVPERALGIDYLIGAAAHRGVGLGAGGV